MASEHAGWPAARVIVRGGGDLGSGVIFRLRRAGFPVIVLELPQPIFVRRTVCYGDAVYEGTRTVEGYTGRLATAATVDDVLAAGEIAVLTDPHGDTIPGLGAVAIVDARMEKRNLDTHLDAAPCVIALGPGFTAGVDCHAVIETNRGHFLGRAYTTGSAEPDTGEPGMMSGHTHSRVLRAPVAGTLTPYLAIGEQATAGQVIAEVGGQPVIAAFDGMLRGLIHPSVPVTAHMKIGDLDPRGDARHCVTLSDKSLAIGGGVLEALLASPAVRTRMSQP